ncbi:MAG: dihydrolipoyl dehydrogenase [Deltaproteobacteria bacterium]|nr:dihydrolipoyl dehydrogenase [Deltaproteobacteria bacterium]
MTTSSSSFDLVVIGGGPGGYVAAIRAAQLGMNTACVEKSPSLGGTCLNVGCIPSKALLETSHLYHTVAHGLDTHGIKAGSPSLDVAQMLARKDRIVGELTRGVGVLFKKNKVTHLPGAARLVKPGEVEVTAADGGKTIVGAKRILIATGSEPTPLPFAPFDGERIVGSTEALSFSQVPRHLIVIGAGVIGLELGSVWLRLGAKVTVVEMLPSLLAGVDAGMARLAQRAFTKQGFTFHLGAKVEKVEKTAQGVVVRGTGAKGETLELEGDRVLVAVGRRPYTAGLGAQEAGVALDPRGRIVVDENFQTNLPGVFAVGDVIAGPMLAHKAMEEGVAAVERMAGHASRVNYEAIPSVVYTHPEIAWVGRGEETLKAAGVAYKAGSYPFMANGRAKTMESTEGQVKVLADAQTDRLLGVLVMGPGASELIAEAVVAMEFEGSAEDLALACHAHPTLSEAMKEAALGVAGRAVHA